jgi:hypothetical protein
MFQNFKRLPWIRPPPDFNPDLRHWVKAVDGVSLNSVSPDDELQMSVVSDGNLICATEDHRAIVDASSNEPISGCYFHSATIRRFKFQ